VKKIELLEKENLVLKEELILKNEFQGHVSVLDNIPLALIHLDFSGNFIFGNDFFFSLFDLDYSFIDKNTNISSFSPLWGTELIEKINTLLRKHETFNIETSLKQDHQKRIYKARGVAVRNDQDQVSSYLIIIGDITQRKMAENQLIDAKERAEESDRLKTAFISNISHEIRTPINHIMGFLELLSIDDIDAETRNEYRNIIYNSSQSLLNSIENIIDIAKIKSGQIKLKTNKVNVNEMLKSVAKLSEEIVKKNNKQNLEIRTNLPDDSDDYHIQIDDYRLKQIIKNLVENAIKFTNEGYVEFGYKQSKNGHLYFYVRDTGIGISQEDFDHIFQNFRQIDYRNTREVEGSGLGLSISKGLAELLNARLELRSVIGKGSVFSLYFPNIKCKFRSKNKGIQKEIFDAGF
jgi:signal transduction histidine kinase